MSIHKLVESNRQLVRDEDIRLEREEVHPELIDLFKSQEQSFRRTLPKEFFTRISEFFVALSPYDAPIAEIDHIRHGIIFVLGTVTSEPHIRYPYGRRNATSTA